MSTNYTKTRALFREILEKDDLEEFLSKLKPNAENPAPQIPRTENCTQQGVNARWDLFENSEKVREQITDPQTKTQMDQYKRNIENFVGTVKVPVGLAGPLRVNGMHAQGDYYIPLATSEAALVASYSRGASLISLAGGCTSIVLNEGVTRAPAFAFDSLAEASQFALWAINHIDDLKKVAESTTRYGKFSDLRITVEGNHVYLGIEICPGDASGQNMVTIAADAICAYIAENAEIKPKYFFVEGNLSGDKKASALSFLNVRGKKVSAEAVLSAELIYKVLKTSPESMIEYWRMSALGGVMSGTIGVQGHYANGLAALYIACGQDAACVSESAVGVTRFELTEQGDLYASVTLPNLIVGTVGGGTGLPSQNACLEMMNLSGSGKARALAEVAAGLCLAGELSIIGALSAGHFTSAHQRLARGANEH